jgi:hypothetical protein
MLSITYHIHIHIHTHTYTIPYIHASKVPTYHALASFTVSQKDIFASVLRVTGGQPKDWTITYEPSAERVAKGTADFKEGDMLGLVCKLYARGLYPVPGMGDTERHHGLINDAIGLERDNIDEGTRRAIKRAHDEGTNGRRWHRRWLLRRKQPERGLH